MREEIAKAICRTKLEQLTMNMNIGDSGAFSVALEMAFEQQWEMHLKEADAAIKVIKDKFAENGIEVDFF